MALNIWGSLSIQVIIMKEGVLSKFQYILDDPIY